ncbi:hypothetical protein Q5752_001156 [Cryptotrichosporon argae]
MSWKTAGKLVSGPPAAAGSASGTTHGASGDGLSLAQRHRPNRGGLSAYERERQLAAYGEAAPRVEGRTEWDVLRENHRFIRDDEAPADVSWEERLARAYESKLFKEFALIDLKHYKSKRLALRWRTAPEVVDGIGEDTCGSLRCRHHLPASADPRFGDSEFGTPHASDAGRDDEGAGLGDEGSAVRLRSYELPFVYAEAGERKEALVKVRLCRRCERKLV